MSHRPVLLSAMLDGELAEAESAWMAAHLDGCGECRSELEDLAAARAAVRSLPLLDLPDGIVPADGAVTSLWPRRVAVAVMSVAAAAVVGVGALGVLGMVSDSVTTIDVAEAEAILAATGSIGVVSDGSVAAEYLADDVRARYRARQIMACRDDTTFVDNTVDVTRLGNVTVMSDPLAHWTVLAGGSVSTGPSEGPIETVTVTGPPPRMGAYSVTGETRDEFRGRDTDIVTLGRDGVDRANLWIDVETSAIVHRELLTADGTVACVAELVEFEPIEDRIQASMPFDIRAVVTESVYSPVASDLPSTLAGLELVAAYPIDGGEVGVFGDGLFAFAVVRVDGAHPQPGLSETSPAVVWEAAGESWAVVGQLPQDLLERVIGDLPPAEKPNPFVDGWRILFG